MRKAFLVSLLLLLLSLGNVFGQERYPTRSIDISGMPLAKALAHVANLETGKRPTKDIMIEASESGDSTLIPVLFDIVEAYSPLYRGYAYDNVVMQALYALSELGVPDSVFYDYLHDWQANPVAACYSASILALSADSSVYREIEELDGRVDNLFRTAIVQEFEFILDIDSTFRSSGGNHSIAELVIWGAGNIAEATTLEIVDDSLEMYLGMSDADLSPFSLYVIKLLREVAESVPDSVYQYLHQISENPESLYLPHSASELRIIGRDFSSYMIRRVFPRGYPPRAQPKR